MQEGSPEWLAWDAARKIDRDAVQDHADRAADEAAYGCPFPNDPEEYGRLLYNLDAAGVPRDGAAWATARRTAQWEGYYPVQQVRGWFSAANIESCDPRVNLSERCGAACDQFLSNVLGEGTRRSDVDGPEDLRKLLSDIAKSESRLAGQLTQLLREATRAGHAATDRGRQIRSIYAGIFSSMLDGAASAAGLNEGRRSLLSALQPQINIEGTRYVGGQTIWEAGLRRSSRWISGLLDHDRFWASLPSAKHQLIFARPLFVHEMSAIWFECTGVPATFSDRSPSPFYRFIRSAYGHMRGLRQAANPADIEQRLRNLRLDPIPTARTMKKDLSRLELKPVD